MASKATYKVLERTDYSDSFNELDAFALDVLVGLSERHKTLPSKYLYDARGSELFRKITQMPEYYPTDCEVEVLERHKDDILEFTKREEQFNLVELGAGFGRKTKILLDHFTLAGCKVRYVPIDISESATRELVEACAKEYPDLEVDGIVSDYFAGLKYLNNRYDCRDFVIFLGSSIGNLTSAQARVFLRNLWNCLDHRDLALIGFDLKKDIELLLSAYNDKQGTTAEFNFNLLHRINRELGGNFDISKFRHFGTYDVFSGGMESYLVSLENQEVFIEYIGRSFSFAPWEPIHTEYSYKYLIEDIERLASDTGFVVLRHLLESRKYYADSIWRVNKPGNGA